MNIALFFTSGISDLKFISSDGSLLELEKKRGDQDDSFASVRQVHEALLALGAKNICLAPFDAEMPKVKSIDVSFMRDEPLLDKAIDATMQEHVLARDAQGRLMMAAGKLELAWQRIIQENAQVLGLVGLRTLRTQDNGEPVASEYLIFEKIRAQLPSLKHAALVEYVQGNERIEDKAGNFSALALQRINSAVAACRAALSNEEIEPWLATSGGVPDAKAVVRAAVELHFGPPRTILRREDGIAATFARSAQESLIARRHALTFVRRGALVEAAAVAEPFATEPSCLPWVHALSCASHFFDGNPVEAYANGNHPKSASAWERSITPPPKFLRTLARSIAPPQGKRCLLAGLRAEAALRNGRWLEAINASVTFFDAALRDAIEQRYGRFNDITRQLTLRAGVDIEPALLAPVDTRFSCFDKKSNKVHTGGKHTERWCSHLTAEMETLHRCYQEGENNPNQWRNANTHAILTDNQIEAARASFINAKLWVQHGAHTSFYAAPAIQNTLRALGASVDNPLDIIIKEVERLLLNADN